MPSSRPLAVLATALAVAAEPWALAVLGLATYSWLEREVRAVVEVVLPLAVALALGAGVAEAIRVAEGAAHALSLGGIEAAAQRLFPGPHVLALVTFAAYSLLVYRRRAVGPLGVAAAASVGVAGRYGGGALVAGVVCGLALAAAAYGAAVRLARRGPLAARRRPAPGADAERPTA
jgi:hypothetical protein